MKEYLNKYPWLNAYPESDNPVCALRWIPEGWVKAFGDIMCEELDAALRKTDDYHEAYVVEAKEKYGSLRIHLYPYNDEIFNILLKYECISQYVCCECGKLDSPMLNIGGWISPYCKECYDKLNKDNRHSSFEDVIDGESTIPDVVKWRRCDETGWHDCEMDIRETVLKIREKAKL